jgi:hypothetical protein
MFEYNPGEIYGRNQLLLEQPAMPAMKPVLQLLVDVARGHPQLPTFGVSALLLYIMQIIKKYLQ